jgi:hypothetical protein
MSFGKFATKDLTDVIASFDPTVTGVIAFSFTP